MTRSLLVLALVACPALTVAAREPIRLPNNPALSPDGKTVAFDWNGDIWTVPTDGGTARALTHHSARDTSPRFSPDGKEIAFVSDREGSNQVFVMPADGGTPKQMTFHAPWTGGTERAGGFTLHEWLPDGSGWLVGTQWDHGWGRRNNDRLQVVRRSDDPDKRTAPELVFDDYAQNGALSPDGKSVLFNREGPEWWRKGYTGSQSAQLWRYDREARSFARVPTGEFDSRWPMWGRDGKVYFTNGQGGCFNIWEHDTKSKQNRQVTRFTDDSTVFPAISRDGSTLVFRHLFDLYRIRPGSDERPTRIDIYRDDDRPVNRAERRVLSRATAAAFTADGLEMALVIGGDVWVMDTELREPKRVTRTAEEERQPVFSPDGKALFFVSDSGGKPEIWKVTRQGNRPWFLTDKFQQASVTDDGEEKSALSFSPDGSKMAYVRGRGELYVADADGRNPKRVVRGWNAPQYDWSPDGKWLVYAVFDSDFNRDVWIRPVDGSREPYNLSRHPYNESAPVWSPDGRLIAFVGERDSKDRTDIHYVWLRAEDDEKSSRDRTLDKALEKLRKGPTPKKQPGPTSGDADQDPKGTPVPNPKDPGPPAAPKKGSVEVTIDFEELSERVRRVSIPNSNESSLLWSPDSKKLAFQGTVDGQSGTYTIEIPEGVRPTQLTTSTGTHARWLRSGSIVWLSAGRPASVSTAGGGGTTPPPATPGPTRPGFSPRGPGARGASSGPSETGSGGWSFTVYQDVDLGKKHQAAFDMCWRTMRDNWYDERLNNRPWDSIREKYRSTADTPDTDALTTVVQLMLGELNGSHLGFTTGTMTLPGRRQGQPAPEEPTPDRNWRPVTPHLGIRFDPDHKGPGLKVRDVLPDGPADHKRSKINAGELVVTIDGVAVDPQTDLSRVLNGPPGREFRLQVKDQAGKEREVTIRPISYTDARRLLYQKWLKDNRAMVEKRSDGKLGYLHISAMDMPSFRKFEEELYAAGAGKEGLVIDVRENGGGSTADHLLTALTQPRHAIAVPRGGGAGYPQDRTVYATWDKPIVVLCNQNSFSNAEIFSHAVKTLKRGKVIGVQTAGGVISTGGTSIMDVGFLRLPFRGWYVIDSGEDMERHGAMPDVVVWPAPGDATKGKDAQIAKAVEVLTADVKVWKERARPKLNKASERGN